MLRWLTQKLREIYLGPGRDALVREIRQQLKAEPKANKSDVKRLEKRVADLEKEVSRLVRAFRTLDAEAEGIADHLWDVSKRLGNSDPAVLRDVLHQFVSRITCR